jgi:hypothetical protein
MEGSRDDDVASVDGESLLHARERFDATAHPPEMRREIHVSASEQRIDSKRLPKSTSFAAPRGVNVRGFDVASSSAMR